MTPQSTAAPVASKPLALASAEAIAISIPLKKAVRMGNDTVTHADNVLVRLQAEDGTVGWGEATDALAMTGEGQADILATVRDAVLPALKGADLLDWDDVGARLDRAAAGKPTARSAVDIAVHDLAGRHFGFSLNHILGGVKTKIFHPMWMLGNATAEEDAVEAAAKIEIGYQFLKLKVGMKTVEEDIRAAHLVRDAVGATFPLTSDANTSLTLADAQRFAEQAAKLGYLCLEQPVGADDLDGMAEIAGGPLAIAADEGLHGLSDIEAHYARGAASGFSLKFIKLGGFAGMQAASKICAAHGLKINLACKTGETSIGAAAMLQFAATIGEPEWGISISADYLTDDVVTHPIHAMDGVIQVPSGVGLGVEVDPNQVDRYRI